MSENMVFYGGKKESGIKKPDGKTLDFHSRKYHSYFEGYTEVQKVLPNGKTKIEHVYTDTYRIQDLSDRQRIGLRAAYILLFAAAVALFVAGALESVGSNTTVYVTAAEVVSLVGLFWILCTLVNYLTAPRKLTIYEYRTTSVSIRRSAVTAAAGLFAAFFLTVVYLLLHLDAAAMAEFRCALCLLFSAGASLGICALERKIPYREEESKEAEPAGGFKIC